MSDVGESEACEIICLIENEVWIWNLEYWSLLSLFVGLVLGREKGSERKWIIVWLWFWAKTSGSVVFICTYTVIELLLDLVFHVLGDGFSSFLCFTRN
jgi:hypothetical protein